MAIHLRAETVWKREEGMRRHDEAALSRLQASDILESLHRLGAPAAEIQQKNVAPGDGPFDPGNEDDATFAGVPTERLDVELFVVQSDGKSLITKLGRSVDELVRRVRDDVGGILRRVRVQFSLELAYGQFNDGRISAW